MSSADKALVFISCGQIKGSQESEIAEKIRTILVGMGYEPYIAIEQQTLKGVIENIFRVIDESEYFIFIDFRREQLRNEELEIVYRGSLFSHQELAIASYLDKNILAFQEKGVKERDGILGFIQANPILFETEDRINLDKKVANKIKENNTKWKNKLLLERKDREEYRDAIMIRGGDSLGVHDLCRWYHIAVKNLHKWKMAFDCIAYLTGIKYPDGEVKRLDPIELKWQGTTLPSALIPYKYHRNFDAIIVPHNKPDTVYFGINWSLIDFYPPHGERYSVHGPGIFELNYTIYSSNFPIAVARFLLEIVDTLEDLKFYQLDE